MPELIFFFYFRPNRKFLSSDDSSEESSETEMSVVQMRQSPRKKARSVLDLPELPKLLSSAIASKNPPSTSASQALSPLHQTTQSNTLFETFKSPTSGITLYHNYKKIVWKLKFSFPSSIMCIAIS